MEENQITIVDEKVTNIYVKLFSLLTLKNLEKIIRSLSPIGEVDEDGDQIYDAMAYEQNEEEGGTLLPIESEEEWEMVQEMFNTLADEQEAE